MILQDLTIGDIALGFFDGPHATPKPSDSGPVFLGIKNISPSGRLDLQEIRHIADSDFPRWTKRVVPRVDDIVFSYEATLHRYALIPEGFHGCLGRRLALLRLDAKKAHPKFIHYYFLSSIWFSTVSSFIISGATVDRIPLMRFLDFPISLPDLKTQRKISETLAIYDDLIENNRRRIALLEEAAQQIYKEWFVRLRFPSYEISKITNGIPKGWEKIELDDWLQSYIGGGWGKDEHSSSHPEQGFVIRGTDIPNARLNQIDRVPFRFHSSSNIRSRILCDGDLVFEVSGGSKGQPVGRSLLITSRLLENFDEKVICASFCKKLRPKKRITSEYLDLHLKFIRDAGLMDVFATQSASNITNFKFTAFLNQHRILKPSDEVLSQFNSIVSPVLEQIQILGSQILKLTEARDLLLPRLMSGEIQV